MDEEEGSVGLSSALEVLREELEAAWQAGQGKRVRFRVSEVTVTMQVVARRKREAAGKLRWYVLEAGGGAKSSGETTQSLVLTLTPGFYDESGNPSPLDVRGVQPQPGG
jgi:Trypsin-co-occurring domain 2